MIRIAKVCAVLVAVFSISSFAGESCFQKGNSNIQAGLGLGMGSVEGMGDGFAVGAVATYEYAIHDLVSVGGSFAFTGKKETDEGSFVGYIYKTEAKAKSINFALRGNFHPFNLPALADKVGIRNKLDVYGGMAMGFAIRPIKIETTTAEGTGEADGDDNKFLFSVLVGAKFYFTNNIGVYLEESAISTGIFNLGAVFKF